MFRSRLLNRLRAVHSKYSKNARSMGGNASAGYKFVPPKVDASNVIYSQLFGAIVWLWLGYRVYHDGRVKLLGHNPFAHKPKKSKSVAFDPKEHSSLKYTKIVISEDEGIQFVFPSVDDDDDEYDGLINMKHPEAPISPLQSLLSHGDHHSYPTNHSITSTNEDEDFLTNMKIVVSEDEGIQFVAPEKDD